MRVVALEETVMDVALMNELMGPERLQALSYMRSSVLDNLQDFGEGRIRSMDDNGVTVQVISTSVPGAEELEGNAGVEFAHRMNNRVAEAVRERPNRLAGFANLPMRTPEAAADELERAVTDLGFRGTTIHGMTKDKFLDAVEFEPVLARAEALDVPIYLHPNFPPKAVFDAYYSDLPPSIAITLSVAGYGWHTELGLHILRLAVKGVFHRFPGLKIIIGHMGEALPFMLARTDYTLKLNDQIDYSLFDLVVDRVHVTTSGLFTLPPFMNLLQTFGADRILFSADYPYCTNEEGRGFLDMLAPNVSPSDFAKICHGNADRLLKLG